MSGAPLPRSFYDRDPPEVARQLLGKLLVRQHDAGRTSGRIVEVEAYLHVDDPASHSSRGQTRRNASMFGQPGIAYVYTIHTRYCLNVVTQPLGTGSAILIRAIEPVEGVALMNQRRNMDAASDDPRQWRQLVNGPGKLCQALDIDRTWDGWDLTRGEGLWVEAAADVPEDQVRRSGRIGISRAQELLLRYYLAGNHFVSGPRHRH